MSEKQVVYGERTGARVEVEISIVPAVQRLPAKPSAKAAGKVKKTVTGRRKSVRSTK